MGFDSRVSAAWGGSTDVTVRLALDDELEDTARLRWIWTQERGTAVTTTEAEYVMLAAQWAREHAGSHLPHIAVTADGGIIGMAWLALTERVPTVTSPSRVSGDLQSCYVVVPHRNTGIGARLVDAVLETARTHGAEHVTVHASPDSTRLYARRGFRENPRLLWAATPPDANPG